MVEVTKQVRQWLILMRLSKSRAGISLKDLASEVGVSQKTLRRDLQALSQSGFALSETMSDFGRKLWKLQQNENVPRLEFDPIEAAALYLGRRLLDSLAGTYLWEAAQTAHRKIRASLGDNAAKYLDRMAPGMHITNLGGSDYQGMAEIIDALMIGIEDRKHTEITYQSQQATEPVTYHVYPYGLIHHHGSLYLVAYAPHHDALRHYKVDRISHAAAEKLRFNRPAGFDLGKHLANSFGVFQGSGTTQEVRVRFRPEVARYVSEGKWHPSQTLQTHSDGGLTASFQLDTTEEIRRWILGFGAAAEVLAPSELREILADEVTKLSAIYHPPRASVPRPHR